MSAVRTVGVDPSAPHEHPAARRAMHIAFATVVFFTLFAGAFWRNLLTWWGFGAVAIALATVVGVWLVRHRSELSVRMLPVPLTGFVLWAVASLIWSQWRLETLLGLAETFILLGTALALATMLTWAQLLRAFGSAMKWIVALSFAFELFVAVFIRGPVLPLYLLGQDAHTTPVMQLWSRGLLFDFEAYDAGKIQGITGNSIDLGLCSLLLVIVVALRLADGTHRWSTGIVWIVLGALGFALTRSASVIVAAVAVALVIAVVLLRRRITRTGPAVAFGACVVALVAAGIAVVAVAWQQLLALLGKSGDLTGRAGFWEVVANLAQEHPVIGSGWLGYWPIWRPEFDDLLVRWGTVQLHAHNAWLDLWFQVGFIGAALFLLAFVATAVRAWWEAAQRPWIGVAPAGGPLFGRYTAQTLFPIAVLTVLAVLSLTESRLLVEQLAVFALLAIKLKSSNAEREALAA